MSQPSPFTSLRLPYFRASTCSSLHPSLLSLPTASSIIFPPSQLCFNGAFAYQQHLPFPILPAIFTSPFIPSSCTTDLHSHFFPRLFPSHPTHTFIHPAFPFLISPCLCLSLGLSPNCCLDSSPQGQGSELGPGSLSPVNRPCPAQPWSDCVWVKVAQGTNGNPHPCL